VDAPLADRVTPERRLPTETQRTNVPLTEERDPYQLARRLMRERLWGSAASYAAWVMGHYHRFVRLVAGTGYPPADRDALIALATKTFPGVHRRTVRSDIARAQAELTKAATP
jgi:hypothetical protein